MVVALCDLYPFRGDALAGLSFPEWLSFISIEKMPPPSGDDAPAPLAASAAGRKAQPRFPFTGGPLAASHLQALVIQHTTPKFVGRLPPPPYCTPPPPPEEGEEGSAAAAADLRAHRSQCFHYALPRVPLLEPWTAATVQGDDATPQ